MLLSQAQGETKNGRDLLKKYQRKIYTDRSWKDSSDFLHRFNRELFYFERRLARSLQGHYRLTRHEQVENGRHSLSFLLIRSIF